MLDRAVKADTLVLTQPDGSEHERGKHDRTTKVRVRINGSKTPVESALPDDELMPAAIPLGSALPVKKIEIEILERVKGSAWPGNAGFAEIALENRAKERR